MLAFVGYFYLWFQCFCLEIACIFACKSRQFRLLVAGKFAWVRHVKLPVKYPWYSGRFTCNCRKFACILRKMPAASTQVNLPVFTSNLHVTQVNCVWGLFTCELQVKLPAFAGNFARASFTVFIATAFFTADNSLKIRELLEFQFSVDFLPSLSKQSGWNKLLVITRKGVGGKHPEKVSLTN